MGCRIRIAPEVEKWLAGLTSYMGGGWRGGPAPSEVPRWILGQIGYRVALPGLDAAYRGHLVTLTGVRRAVADVATSRKRLELRIGELERLAGKLEDPDSEATDASRGGPAGQGQTPREAAAQLAGLRRQYADLQAKEERLTAASRRLMAEIHAFRASEEATKAAYTAAGEAARTAWDEVSG